MPFFPQREKYYLSFILKARKNVLIGMEFNSYIIVKELFHNFSVMGGDAEILCQQSVWSLQRKLEAVHSSGEPRHRYP
jgi:hypothetical protein